MEMEAGDVVVAIDSVPFDDILITVDPVIVDPIVIEKPFPEDAVFDDAVLDDAVLDDAVLDDAVVIPVDDVSDLPPDVQTFGGPTVEPEGDSTATDGVIAYDLLPGGLPTDEGNLDDLLMVCTGLVIDEPTSGDPKPEIADDGFVTVALVDPEVYPGTDGATDGAGVEGTTSDDVGTDTTLVETDGEVIGRPLDPETNWRTLTGEGDEDQPVIACVDYPINTADGTDLPLMVDPKPDIADDGFVTVTLVDPEVYPGTDGATDGVGVEDTTSDDIGTDTTLVETDGEVIGRPLDPEPNWRTLTGEGDEDQPVIACVDYPINTADGTDLPLVVDKEAVVDDSGLIDVGTTDIVAEDEPVIYTLDDSDPLIYATTGGELPGRPSDPLPFWRTNSVPAVTEVEVDPAPVHYAAADTFHTGLDLL